MKVRRACELFALLILVSWVALRASVTTLSAARPSDAAAATAALGAAAARHDVVPWPKTIHMTWKTTTLPSWAEGNWRSWAEKNPQWTRRLWDDAAVDAFVAQEFPEIMPYWKSVLKPVQRADVFRYLALYVHGGVYADIDVTCMRPVEAWFTRAGAYYNAGFVAGFEEVTARKDWRKWFATQFQVVQWTMGSVPRHPVLRAVLDEVLAYYRAGKHLGPGHKSIIKSTGPGIWSLAIAKHLRRTYGIEFGAPPFTHAVLKSRGIHAGDVLLLPKAAFATQGGGGGSSVMVLHNFRGTWKKGYVPAADEKSKPLPQAKHAGASRVRGSAPQTASAAIPSVTAECLADKEALCGNIQPGGGRTHKCLEQMKRDGKLSKACEQSGTFRSHSGQ